MTMEIPRIRDVPPEVEKQLAIELSDRAFIYMDPEVALMSPVCGLASHSLAVYLEKRRGHKVSPYRGSIPTLTELDRGFDFSHVLLRDPYRNTIIDPTPLQILSFAGYHIDYILKHFPQPPESVVGDVRIVEFPDTAEGVSLFADQMTQIAMNVKSEAMPVRDKLKKSGGQPLLDMSEGEIREVIMDVWDMSHYNPDPIEGLSDEVREEVLRVGQRLIEVKS